MRNQFRNDFADEVYRKRFQQQESAQEEAQAEQQAADAEVSDEEDDFYNDENEIYTPTGRGLSKTQRLGLTIVSCIAALITMLALEINGVPVKKIARRTVRRVMNPHRVVNRDPFKAQEENAGSTTDDVIVLRRTD